MKYCDKNEFIARLSVKIDKNLQDFFTEDDKVRLYDFAKELMEIFPFPTIKPQNTYYIDKIQVVLVIKKYNKYFNVLNYWSLIFENCYLVVDDESVDINLLRDCLNNLRINLDTTGIFDNKL